MEDTYNTRAIVLDRKSFREKDSKITVFSEDKGKLELIARGSKKIQSKLAGHIEPITLVNLMVARGKRIDYVATSIGEDFFSSIKENLDKISVAGAVVKFINSLSRVDETDNERSFFLLKDFLNIVNIKKEINNSLLYNFFVLKFLQISGFEPNLETCALCNEKISPNNNFFDPVMGGLVCANCEKTKENLENRKIIKISDSCIKVMKFVLKNDFLLSSNLKTNERIDGEIRRNIDIFLKYNLDYNDFTKFKK